MAQITALVQDGSEQIELDVPTKAIELNYKFQDIGKPTVSRSPYSFKFALPMTRTNSKFFSFYYDYNVTLGSFSATKKTNVELYDQGVRLMSGVLELYSADHKSQTFSVGIVEQLGELFDLIRDLSWEQLFTTSAGTIDTGLDHALTWDNIIDSWDTSIDITVGGVGAGTIVYPLSDWGSNETNNSDNEGYSYGFLYYTGSTGTGSGIGMGAAEGNAGSLAAKNFKPSIRIQYLIEYILNYAGFTYSSTFLDSADFLTIYMFLASDTERVLGRVSYGFRVGLSSDVVIPFTDVSVWQSLAFTDEASSPFFDPDALINSGSFVAPADGNYFLSARLIALVATPTATYNYSVQLKMTVDGATVAANQSQNISSAVTGVLDYNFLLTLTAGQTVAVEVAHTNPWDAVTIKSSDTEGFTFFNLVMYTSATSFVDVSANFSDFTVDEWLKAIFEKFNLVMTTNPEEPTIVTIEPWHTYWATGDRKDFTKKVDADSIKIEPTTKYQKKTYNFSDSEGEDAKNLWWQHHFKGIYGRSYYENPNEFAVGEGETSDIFQPLRLRQVYYNLQNTTPSIVPNVLVPSFWDWHDGSGNYSMYLKKYVTCKPVLAYYHGLQDIGNGGEFNYGGTPQSTYPYFAEYNTVGVTASTLSLQWGRSYPDNYDAPFVGNGTGGGNTHRMLFYTYWSKMFNEWYGADSRLMTCKLDLSTTDMYNLKFNDYLYIDGSFWRVLSLDNFSLDHVSLANAKLLKVIDAPTGMTSPSCNLSISSFNVDGTVNFVDNETGVAAPATEPCCTINGFLWDSTNSECFYLPASDSGTSAPNGFGGYPEPISGLSNQPIAGGIVGTVSETFAFNGTIGSTYEVQMFASTTDASGIAAQTSMGQSVFEVPVDTIAYMTYEVTMIETGGASGTLGNASSFTAQISFANTRSATGGQSSVRSIGGVSVINTQADAGTSGAITVTPTQRSSGTTATYEVICTGQLDVNATWLINASAATVQLSGIESASGAELIYYDLTPDEVEYGNLSTLTEMKFNL